jgi:hypothetical protein
LGTWFSPFSEAPPSRARRIMLAMSYNAFYILVLFDFL